jgi:beta-lactamase class A
MRIRAASAALVGAVALAAGAPTFDPVALRAAIDRLVAPTGADVAVALRTLDRRDELLIQPDVEFHAASTMKVPVMIELFRRASAGSIRLDDTIPITTTFHSLVDGSPYTLDVSGPPDDAIAARPDGRISYRELCEAMITVSSNLSANLLIEQLGAANIQRTVDRLGAPRMHVRRGVEDEKAFEKGLNNTTTARALLTLLEQIAHGRAGDPASTDAMLAILERQRVNDRIPAGLPPGTIVAHKTGEITRIRHDAGIVYAPRPFVLVVLVRGIDDGAKADALIASIARAAYDATQDGARTR